MTNDPKEMIRIKYTVGNLNFYFYIYNFNSWIHWRLFKKWGGIANGWDFQIPLIFGKTGVYWTGNVSP
jgi:hypothetical protein